MPGSPTTWAGDNKEPLHLAEAPTGVDSLVAQCTSDAGFIQNGISATFKRHCPSKQRIVMATIPFSGEILSPETPAKSASTVIKDVGEQVTVFLCNHDIAAEPGALNILHGHMV